MSPTTVARLVGTAAIEHRTEALPRSAALAALDDGGSFVDFVKGDSAAAVDSAFLPGPLGAVEAAKAAASQLKPRLVGLVANDDKEPGTKANGSLSRTLPGLPAVKAALKAGLKVEGNRLRPPADASGMAVIGPCPHAMAVRADSS
jgi:hypothetical protein